MKGISSKLQKMIPEYKDGETYEFALLGIKWTKATGRERSTMLVPSRKNIPSNCTIWDPGTEENVTISLIDMVLPATSRDKDNRERVKLGRAEFVKTEKGRKVLRGHNKKDKNLFEYLFLCSWNAANKDKPWHLEPPRDSYIFEFVDRKNLKKNDLDKKKKKHAATSIALGLEEKDLRILCEKLKTDRSIEPAFNYSETWIEDEVRDRLLIFAEKNPGKVIQMHEEYNFAIEALVIDALDKGIISHDRAKKQIIWAKDKGLVCVCPANKKPKDVLARYFMTEEGKDDLDSIVAQLKDEAAEITQE